MRYHFSSEYCLLQILDLQQPQSDNQQEAPKDDDVIDADYEEVDEDKKASGQ